MVEFSILVFSYYSTISIVQKKKLIVENYTLLLYLLVINYVYGNKKVSLTEISE